MSRRSRFAARVLGASLLLLTLSMAVDAGQRAGPGHPPHPQPAVVLRGHVFIGGYFYDPFYGPYPWWPRTAYPYWYAPVYDYRGNLRLRVTPEGAKHAAVYVDGFYAGVVDDFDGAFQGLPLTPGGHTITLYLEGHHTVRHNIYLRPGSTFTLRYMMEPLPAGEKSEPPEVAPPIPAPPAGTYWAPATSPPIPAPPTSARTTPQATGFGTLDLHVQPASAEVTIDGKRWVSSDEGHFVLQLPGGRHRIDITKRGHRSFSSDIEIHEGDTMPLNVSLGSAPTE